MKQSPSCEASRSLASQEISCILRQAKLYYRFHKCWSHVPFLTHINAVHHKTVFKMLTTIIYIASNKIRVI